MRSLFPEHKPATRLSRLHWLHPVGWLLWVTMIVFLVSFSAGGASSVTGVYLDVSGYLFYFAVLAALITPLVLFPVQDIPRGPMTALRLPLRTRFIWIPVLVYAGVNLVRILALPEWQYEQIRLFTPPPAYFLSFTSWLLGGIFLWQLLLRSRWTPAILLMLYEFAVVVLIGFREWAVWYALLVGIIVVFSCCKIGNRHFVLLLALFVLVFSPLQSTYRSAASYVNGLEPDRQQETSALREMPRYLSHYPEFLVSGMERLGAEGAMTAEIIRTVPEEQEYRSSARLFRELGVISIPRMFWADKPEFRPGEEIYATFIDEEDRLRRTYPAGWPGELYWHFGWGSIPAAFLLSSFLVWVWNKFTIFLRYAPAWLVTHYALVFGFTQTHLIFFASSWLRILPLYLLCGVLIWLWKPGK